MSSAAGKRAATLQLSSSNTYDYLYAPIIVDNGSGYIKADYAFEKIPNEVFPTVFGRTVRQRGAPRQQSGLFVKPAPNRFVGHKAQSQRSILALSNPIQRGVVTNWDEMEKIYDYLFLDLMKTNVEEHPIVLTDSVTWTPFKKIKDRERLVQIMFEHFKTPVVCVASSILLAIRASGRRRGVMLESGYGVTQVISFGRGPNTDYLFPKSLQRVDVGGSDVTDYMTHLLQESNTITAHEAKDLFEMHQTVNNIKEQKCRVVLDKNDLQGLSKERQVRETFETSEGQTLGLYDEHLRCPEVLFQPYSLGFRQPSVQELAYAAIVNFAENIQDEVYFGNVLYSGGNTLFSGFPRRLERELALLSPTTGVEKILVQPANERPEFAAWTGAAMLANCEELRERSISKADYIEFGPYCVHRKCR